MRAGSASSSRTWPVSRTIGPTRAIAPNVSGERSMPSACPVAGASKITRSCPRREPPAPPLRELARSSPSSTSSRAPGAAAAKYWKVPLEARIRPGTRPPSACTHSSSARSGSIEIAREARLRGGVSAPGVGGRAPNSSASPRLLAHLDDDRAPALARPRAGRARPRSSSCRRLPCRSRRSACGRAATASARQSALKTARLRAAAPTIVRMGAPPRERSTSRSPTTSDGLVPCVVQDWDSGEVLTLAYMNARGAAAHARDRRAAPVEPLARRAVAQGRDERQHRRPCGRCGSTATATPLLALVEPAGPGLPHRRAHLLPPRRARAGRAARDAARRSSARSRERAARAPGGLLHGRAARRPAADRREGDGGGRGGQRAPRARRATSASTKRPPTSSTTCSCCCAAAGRSLSDAERVLDGRRS